MGEHGSFLSCAFTDGVQIGFRSSNSFLMPRPVLVVLLWLAMAGLPLCFHVTAAAGPDGVPADSGGAAVDPASPPAASSEKAPSASVSADSAWTPPKYARAVAYRYRIPGEGSSDGPEIGFTMLRKNLLNEDLLKRQTVKSVELKPGQVEKLTEAVNAKERGTAYACYNPHHIFVFYSDKGAVVAAVEICFECLGLSALPDIAEPRWHRHDYHALAMLVDEVGLWPETAFPVKDWIEMLNKREAEAEKENKAGSADDGEP